MKIHLTNISDNITVPYSTLLIRGKIVNSGKECEKSVIIYSQLSEESKRWPVTGREFICYVKLFKGCNILTVKYASTQLKIRVNYKPPNLDKYVLPVYIVCKDDDGRFQAPNNVDNSVQSACKRIELGVKMLQLFVAESLYAQGFGKKTFKLCGDEENCSVAEKCLVLKSCMTKKVAQSLSSIELWKHFACELMELELVNKENYKFLAFMSFTEYENNSNEPPVDHQHMLQMTKGYSALGGGGLALVGTGCLHTWPTSIEEIIPCFTDCTKIDALHLMDDSCNRGSYWACYSTSLGATLHELGHTFNLVHNPNGIMARGFDDIYNFFILPHMLNQNRSLVEVNSQFSATWGLKNDNFGDAVWYHSSAIILAHHRWLNTSAIIGQAPVLSGSTITSSQPIKLIEFRNADKTSLCFQEFNDLQKFDIDIEKLDLEKLSKLKAMQKKITIFILDCAGNFTEQEMKT